MFKSVIFIVLLGFVSTSNAVNYSNGKSDHINHIDMYARMNNGVLTIKFFYKNSSGNFVQWLGGKNLFQCAVYENNGSYNRGAMGAKRAWTGNIKLGSHSEELYMNNVYVNNFASDSAIVQCFVKFKKYSNNIRSVFWLSGS